MIAVRVDGPKLANRRIICTSNELEIQHYITEFIFISLYELSMNSFAKMQKEEENKAHWFCCLLSPEIDVEKQNGLQVSDVAPGLVVAFFFLFAAPIFIAGVRFCALFSVLLYVQSSLLRTSVLHQEVKVNNTNAVKRGGETP